MARMAKIAKRLGFNIGGVLAVLGTFYLVMHPISANSTILPKNTLHLEDSIHALSSMTKDEFNQIIDKVAKLYAPIVALHGATLKVERLWDSPVVNAYASQSGTTWEVAMYGGLARRDEVTADGFALVMCHELGHHLAGFPFYGDQDWAATEGQSDYFATQNCARKIWLEDHAENAKYESLVDPIAKTQCDGNWKSKESRNLCYRIAHAGESLAELLGVLSSTGTPDYTTPDTSEVSTTMTSHPDAQCRLDTYFNGALCNIRSDISMIPGKSFAKRNSAEAERSAGFQMCSRPEKHTLGLRPKCWFKPR